MRASSERWSRTALERTGFEGWHRFADLPSHLGAIPRSAGGVYVVYRDAPAAPVFLERNPGGTWRGDPSESVEALTRKWVRGAKLIYIGKANHGQLRNRLRAYYSFGRGGAGRHYGGRYIWQLADAWGCLVAWWVVTPDQSPRDIEAAMIADFLGEMQMRPFANVVG